MTRSRAAGAAGVASTTASASIRSGAVVGPTVRANPVVVRVSSRTVAPVRTLRPAASVSASRPMPPGIPAKTGRSSVVGIAAACSRTEPRVA